NDARRQGQRPRAGNTAAHVVVNGDISQGQVAPVLHTAAYTLVALHYRQPGDKDIAGSDSEDATGLIAADVQRRRAGAANRQVAGDTPVSFSQDNVARGRGRKGNVVRARRVVSRGNGVAQSSADQSTAGRGRTVAGRRHHQAARQ